MDNREKGVFNENIMGVIWNLFTKKSIIYMNTEKRILHKFILDCKQIINLLNI